MGRCALAAVLFGVTTPVVSVLGDRLTPFVLAGLLYVGAALAVAPWVVHRPPTRSAVRAGLRRLVIAVFFGGMVGPVLLMFALANAPASTVSLAMNLEVVFTVALAGLLFGESLGRRVLVGMAAVAVAAASLGWTGEVELRAGVVFAAAACAAWAIDNTVTAHLVDLRPQHITLAKGLVAGTVTLALGLLAGGSLPVGPALLAVVVGGVGYGGSITLWISGAQRIGAARGQVVFAIAPFVGAVTSWLALGDPFGVRSAVAVALAAGGVLLVVTRDADGVHAGVQRWSASRQR
jgi:drug/metabolite transporter (DMT)-like permease